MLSIQQLYHTKRIAKMYIRNSNCFLSLFTNNSQFQTMFVNPSMVRVNLTDERITFPPLSPFRISLYLVEDGFGS